MNKFASAGRAMLIVSLLLFGLTLTPMANSSLPQQPPCYECPLEVDLVHVETPGTASPPEALAIRFIEGVPVGTPFVITFHAIYRDATPTRLSPLTASFGFRNESGTFKTLLNVPVFPIEGQPGNYTYDSIVTREFPNSEIIISVLADNLRDVYGNMGPPSDVDSDTTLIATDNSHLNVGQLSQPGPEVNYLVPAVIAALLIIALLLLLLRGRRKKKA